MLLPFGIIEHVDFDTETVFLDRDKEEIESAPAFDPESHRKDARYYGVSVGRGGGVQSSLIAQRPWFLNCASCQRPLAARAIYRLFQAIDGGERRVTKRFPGARMQSVANGR